MIDVDTLLGWAFEARTHAYDERDCRLYALSIGMGSDPLDTRQLRFVYEPELRSFPTFAATLCMPGSWFSDPATGLVASRVVYAGQRLVFRQPLPVEGRITAETRVRALVDLGEGKGCLVYVERVLADAGGGDPVATVEDVYMALGQGGFGGPQTSAHTYVSLPETPPERTMTIETTPNAALLYRLNGDRSAFHADPAVARAAGFERPVLHGPCVLAMAARAVLELHCDLDTTQLRGIEARFSAPHLPGRPLAIETWTVEGGIAFRGLSAATGKKTLDNGFAALVA